MATKYTLDATHGAGYPSNLVAQKAGHIQSVTCSDDLDNMTIIALGDFIDLDLYKDDGTLAGFEAEIVKKAQNDNWYVRVTKPGNGYLIYTLPLISEEFTKSFQKEARFYNAAGDQARAYQLYVDDVFEANEFSFDGTPAVGAVIKATNADNKMVIYTETSSDAE